MRPRADDAGARLPRPRAEAGPAEPIQGKTIMRALRIGRLHIGLRLVAIAAGLAFAFAGRPATATDLPKSTLAMLQAIGAEPSLLDGVDDELKVPAGWIEAAKKERKIRVSGSRDVKEFKESVKPFKERYPFIDFDYTRVSYSNRVVSILVAYQQGRVITDVMTGFGGNVAQFKEANALESLKDVPNVARVASDAMRDEDGFWVGH